MKFTVRLVRESYVDIEADSLEQAKDMVSNEGISEEDIENGADLWDVDWVRESE